MSANRKPTGFYDGHGKMICVGDRVWYDSGFSLCFHGTIVEHEGAFGVFLDGTEFFSIQELSLDDEYPPGLDFDARRKWKNNGGGNTYRTMVYKIPTEERLKILRFIQEAPDHLDLEANFENTTLLLSDPAKLWAFARGEL